MKLREPGYRLKGNQNRHSRYFISEQLYSVGYMPAPIERIEHTTQRGVTYKSGNRILTSYR